MLVTKVVLVTGLADVPDNGITFIVNYGSQTLQQSLEKQLKQSEAATKLKIRNRRQALKPYQAHYVRSKGANAFTPSFGFLSAPPYSTKEPLICRYQGKTYCLNMLEAMAHIYKEMSNIAIFKQTEQLYSVLEQLRHRGVLQDFVVSKGSGLTAELVTTGQTVKLVIGDISSLKEKWANIKVLCE